MLNLNELEERGLEYWKSTNFFQKVEELNKGNKKYYFLDGPPNAYGLAVHHLWVYSVKDIMLKYKRYRGYYVHDRPGFDVHGLPIEIRVERQLGVKMKSEIETRIGVSNFIKACMDYVDGEIKGSVVLLRRLGVFMDFDNVYVPYKRSYMTKSWSMFKSMSGKGLLYKDLKPLAYCPHCETVLSAQGPEVEYQDVTDKAIYVRYKVDLNRSKLKLGPDTYLVIWTTTPWTLPSNMSIAANAKATYVVASDGKEDYIVAKDRLDDFASKSEKSIVIRSEIPGAELVGTYYTSPLEDKVPVQKSFSKYHRVIDGESFVTLSEGTGLLHVAPGHGPEDYALAKKNGIAVFSPIDVHAQYTEEAGAYNGLDVPGKANEEVLKDLKTNGALLATESITHSYPHCWRCHSKLIYRSTDQWFINISKMKKKMLKENSKISWYPQFAQKWFADAIESSPDWCVSRQRYWSTPLPIWTCESCKEMEVLGSVEELEQKTGMQWLKEVDLHKPKIDEITLKCGKCGGTMKRVPDVFDVWYDSGSAHTSSLNDEEFGTLYPADWITESLDQIRGWFTTLLRTGVGAHGKSPFKRVTIGGMMKDEFGEEMHRSAGNAVTPDELLKVTSADGFRLWCLSKPRWQDLKLKKSELREADTEIITMYNISALAKEFAELSGYDLKSMKKPGLSGLRNEDIFILSRMNTLIENVTNSMDGYMIDQAINQIRDFLIEDFSRFYLRMAKQRANDATKGQLKKIAAITGYLLYNTILLSSLATPFASENIYQDLFAKENESIFFQKWPKPTKRMVNTEMENDMAVAHAAITAILSSREKAGISLRWPISKAVLEVTDDSSFTALQKLSAIIEDYVNAKHLELKRISGIKKEVKPVFARLGPDFKEKAAAVADALKTADADEMAKMIDQNGYYTLHTEQGAVDIKPEHFATVEMVEGGDSVSFKYGRAYVDKEITKELRDEALLREFERGVQMIRKELELKKADKIALGYEALGELGELIKSGAKKIAKDLNSKRLSTKLDGTALVKEIDVEGAIVKVSVKKIE